MWTLFFSRARARFLSCSVAPEDQRDVVSAESERVVDGVLVVAITWLARDDVEVDLGIGGVIVQCRWYDAITQRKHRQDRFQGTHRADGGAQRPLGRVDRGLFASGDPDGVRLRRVADRCGGWVRVDGVDFLGGKTPPLQRA